MSYPKLTFTLLYFAGNWIEGQMSFSAGEYASRVKLNNKRKGLSMTAYQQNNNRREQSTKQTDALSQETLRRLMYERIAEGQAMTSIEELAHREIRRNR